MTQSSNLSQLDRLALLPAEEQEQILKSMTPAQRRALATSWKFRRRAKQDPCWDEDWDIWLYLAGRRVGKTASIVHAVNEAVWEGGKKYLCVAGRTRDDLRDILLYGKSGFANADTLERRPEIGKSPMELRWSNGAHAVCLSSEVPDSGRGGGYEIVFGDEVRSWTKKDHEGLTLYDNLSIAASEGTDVRIMLATSPGNNDLLKRIMSEPKTRVTTETTYDNRHNLAPGFIERMERLTVKGSRQHQREMQGMITDDVEGAFWNHEMIRKAVAMHTPENEEMDRIIVTIDPAGTGKKKSDYTGICVTGKTGDQAHILHSERMRADEPRAWAQRAFTLYKEYAANEIAAERNMGYDLVVSNIRSVVGDGVRVKELTATRGKDVRAEPVASLFAAGDRVSMRREFATLTNEMERFPKEHTYDDEIDAMVYGVTNLLIDGGMKSGVW